MTNILHYSIVNNMNIKKVLHELGLSEKESATYVALLELGPSSVREIGEKTKINRGSTHDVLKQLMKLRLVSYYHEATKQKFVAEDPKRLASIVSEKQRELSDTKAKIEEIIPELRTQATKDEEKPVIRYYEGDSGVHTILQDVLDTLENGHHKKYYVFSSIDVRKYLYRSFKSFTKERIAKRIAVDAISIGPGFEEEIKDDMLANRKWLSKNEGAPTFKIIYGGKVALISLGSNNELQCSVIEDSNLYQTETTIFKQLWKTL